jgi:hypothetical protein
MEIIPHLIPLCQISWCFVLLVITGKAAWLKAYAAAEAATARACVVNIKMQHGM